MVVSVVLELLFALVDDMSISVFAWREGRMLCFWRSFIFDSWKINDGRLAVVFPAAELGNLSEKNKLLLSCTVQAEGRKYLLEWKISNTSDPSL